MSRVNILYGGSSALFGSGNIGGALLLENAPDIFDSSRQSIFVSGSAGSFRQFSGGLEGMASGKKWLFSTKVQLQSALNNFPYTNDGTKLNTTNSQLHSTAATLHLAYRSGLRSTLGLTAWLQKYDREIPPALFETMGSLKKQVDGSLRLLLDWNKTGMASNWYVKSSFICDEIKYSDNAVNLNTTSTVYQYYQEAGWRHQMGKFGRIILFAPLQVGWMRIPENYALKQQNRIALAGAYNIRLLRSRLDIAVNARGEAVDSLISLSHTEQSCLLPGADASFSMFSWLSLRANLQRTYRVPSLNELYYYPGGNTSLKPEQGWSRDAGYTVKVSHKNLTVYHDVSVFDRNINDWIIWLGGAIWTPHNIARVHSRGVETENKFTYHYSEWQFHFGVNTAYILATTVSSYIYNDGSIGKQMPYTPRYNGQLNVGFTLHRLYVNYNHTYTGYRFTVSDESDYLLPYNTGNLQIMYTASFKGHTIQLNAQCNNIWNEQYYVSFSRPMPGINWMTGLRLGINE